MTLENFSWHTAHLMVMELGALLSLILWIIRPLIRELRSAIDEWKQKDR
jgi:hypothetical protein